MYLPPQFEVNDRAWVMELISRNPFGSLVTAGAAYPRVTQLPVVASLQDGKLRVVGHVARANPHADSILEGEPATIVVQGPHAYVSASWYERPYETVPTWNYVAALSLRAAAGVRRVGGGAPAGRADRRVPPAGIRSVWTPPIATVSCAASSRSRCT